MFCAVALHHSHAFTQFLLLYSVFRHQLLDYIIDLLIHLVHIAVDISFLVLQGILGDD
jgi:hypothetical protein